jgi:translation initiation factor IF-2
VIFGFDVPSSQHVNLMAAGSDVVVKMHKLIYKFTADLKDLVNDADLAGGKDVTKTVAGSAEVK